MTSTTPTDTRTVEGERVFSATLGWIVKGGYNFKDHYEKGVRFENALFERVMFQIIYKGT